VSQDLRAPVPAAPVLAWLRGRRRRHRPAGQRSDRFTNAYGVLLYLAVGLVIAFRLLRQSPARGSTAAWLLDGGIARSGTAALLLGLLAGLRYATWQGPVVFRSPDVQWLLGAPLARAGLVRSRLARGLVAAGAAGALLGLGAFVLLEAELGVAAGPLLAAAVLGPAAVGLLAAALGWLVERSPATTRAVLRSSPLALAAAVALALAPGGAAGARALLWSGPWGWAVGPLAAAAGASVPGWPAQAALLAAVTAAALLAAWTGSGRVAVEELARRAAARSGLAANLYNLDARGAALVRRRSTRGLLGAGRMRLPRPRRRWLAVPWRDALATLRVPARLGWAAALAGAGVLAVAAEPDRRVLVAAAILAAYLAAAQLAEPLRAEADQPDASRQLPWTWGELLLLHCVVPTLALTLIAAVATGLAWGLGLLHGAAAWLALAGCAPAAAVLVATAAIAGQRGRLEPGTLATAYGLGEFGGPTYLFTWIAAGPLLAELGLGIPAAVLIGAARQPAALPSAATAAAVLLLAALAAELGYLRGRPAPA
jgi:Family of unknown function (DUF6297)